MDKRYIILENKLCKELELLEEKYRTGAEMSEGDLRKIDLLVHSMKSLATYTAMKQSEMNQYNNSSYGMNNGSYSNNSYGNNSYMDNSHMMRQNRDVNSEMSGHYPMNYPMYPEERRW